ncbi:hypothetical protein NDN08_008252 [Rhodosorus marinus]|uniref:Nuclear pore complex protein n=1 Tax=Rhodosorus marinus TaxID=101924 RepID=A0AAV8V2P2_9RHOD|nr:hypothetical protein NDN08_008252 [Rhodosorus marinus]
MLHFFVKKTIIETVFGDLFFHPEELAGVTQERALSVFTNQGEDEAINDIEIGQDQHLPVIKLEQQFRLAVKLSALGSSFRCVARLLEVIREESGSEEYGNTSEAMVISTYARIVCLSPCKSCRRYWKKVWAFSIGLCCSTYRGRSYVDIRVRMYFDGKLRNYPLVELPIFERHTELIYKLFDAVFPDWKISMIGLSTDGDAKIAGSIRGVTTRLEHTLADGVLRAWSGLHQLDLVMQDVVESTFDEEFISKLAKLVGYLRRQLNSSARAGGECPEYCDVRWGSMLKVLKWLKPHRLKVQSDLIELGVAWTPEDSWWVLLHVMADVLEQAQVVFSGLQGLSMVLEEHILRLRKQVEVYCKMCPMLGPLNEHNLEQVDASSAVIGGSFLASYRAVRSFIDGYGRWFLFALDAMEKNSREKLAHSCADLFVHLADGKISKGIAERDSINDAAEETPPFCRTSSYAAICAPTS